MIIIILDESAEQCLQLRAFQCFNEKFIIMREEEKASTFPLTFFNFLDICSIEIGV
jgi:hypothetical protein